MPGRDHTFIDLALLLLLKISAPANEEEKVFEVKDQPG